ncbi:MAG TPA: glutamate--tRNA ligase [Phycisphaerae bacterium]|nr:glutamate--tRNA ligase [Phycisphaerae bacterium]HRW56027.1 glutamate--tRNA ligase [Phycisphaerae bacterium]
MTTENVRARFAPSPTGYLHVGGARSALFNYLFCRRHGGKFVLRIEDTDIDRNIEGAEKKIVEDLRWLGIECDEGPGVDGAYGPYFQSQRRETYDVACAKLLASGDAYYAFDTNEELDALRRQAEAAKTGFRYPRPNPLPTAADADKARAEGRPVVVRFKVPDEAITIHDEILGDVTFEAGQLDDFVIVKSNGWPTYHFAVVVDDAHMAISHVLRAQEHLMNTPKHVFIQRALGVATPKYAHLPLVFNIDGTKMSKRDKHKVVRQGVKDAIKQKKMTDADVMSLTGADEAAVERWLRKKADAELGMDQVVKLAAAADVTIPEIDVHDFRMSGYLPEALLNFIVLIGWSPGGDREKLTRDEMIELFSLDRINKTAGRFDREKLLAMNLDWCSAAPTERLVEAFKDWATLNDSHMAKLDDATLGRVLDSCRGFRTFPDVVAKAGVLFEPDEAVVYDEKAVAKVLAKNDGAGFATLESLLSPLESLESWTAESIEAFVKNTCEATGAKMGDVAQPIRVAVAGRPVSPAIGETLVFLGREKTLNRLRQCLELR